MVYRKLIKRIAAIVGEGTQVDAPSFYCTTLMRTSET